MSQQYHVISEDGIKRICYAVNAIKQLKSVLNDATVSGDTTWSSYLVDLKLKELEHDLKIYMSDTFGVGFTCKILNAEPERADMDYNVLYLVKVLKTDGSGEVDHYDQYIIAEEQKTFIGTTNISFDDTYTKNEANTRFISKNEVINTFTGDEAVGTTANNIPISQTASKALFDKVFQKTGFPTSQHTENKVTLVGAINEIYDKFMDYKDEVEQKFEDFEVEIKKKIYPVGAIYISYDSVNPATLFGGTWEKIENRFLLASGTKALNSTGGSENVTLTTSQMPAHTHTFTGTAHSHSFTAAIKYSSVATGMSGMYIPYCRSVNTNYNDGAYDNMRWYNDSGSYITQSDCDWILMESVAATNNTTAGGTNANTGGGSSHNNMPPYVVVEVWVRKS